MVLSFAHDFTYFLSQIGKHIHHRFPIHQTNIIRENCNKDTLQQYHHAKWAIVDLINTNQQVPYMISLYNWLYHREEDEIAYFLSEAGSNALNYSEFKAPSHFDLWLGERGIIIAIVQYGQSFDPYHISKHNIKENEGAAFSFYHRCKGTIFFDNPQSALVVYYYNNFKRKP